MSAHTHFLADNATYAEEFGDKGGLLCFPPGQRRGLIVTCMDQRINTALLFPEATAWGWHFIRNAGGSADALPSIILSQTIIPDGEIIVVHHTGCGAPPDKVGEVRRDLQPPCARDEIVANMVDEDDPSDSVMYLVRQTVLADVKFLRESPHIRKGTTVTGCLYNVKTKKRENIVPPGPKA